jgi:hypothetical protein
MWERDEKIIKHIGKYGVSIRAVIDVTFFDGGTSDHVINRLIKEKRIVSEEGIPGGLCYYHLTIPEARARGVPDHRARRKKGSALRQALQVLWFCCMSEKGRNRIERKQLGNTFEVGKGTGKPHCAEMDDERSIVHRIYTPGPHSRDDYLLKTLRADCEAALEMPSLKEWIQNSAFGFAVLVETPERQEKLRRLIYKAGPKKLPVLVEVVPGLSTLASVLKTRLAERIPVNVKRAQ